ncbi:MAG: translocation/assembly module TamB, partial [Pseudomonadota bacterium]
EEQSRFVRFVERQISTEDRQIRLGQIEGALSSDVRISSITIADRRGVWLTIEGAELVWSRLALLRGRLSIDSLKADSITVTRRPLPAETDEPLEEGAEEFALPELPVAVLIDAFDIGRVDLAEDVIGEAAALQVAGSLRLQSGELDANLDVQRLDEPGNLTLDASYSEASRQLAIDFTVSEPEDGVIANALNIDGRPAILFEIKGEGELSNYRADISLTADEETLLSGITRIVGVDDGLRFIADLQGNVEPLVADLYDPFVQGGTEIAVDATRASDGTITITEGGLESGVASLAFSGAFAPDGIPTRLSVNGSLVRSDNQPVALPGGGGDATIRRADINVSLGEAADGAFSAKIALTDLDAPFLAAPNA